MMQPMLIIKEELNSLINKNYSTVFLSIIKKKFITLLLQLIEQEFKILMITKASKILTAIPQQLLHHLTH